MSKDLLQVAKIILEILEDEGGQARFVGGCVRDHICGRAVKDIDISTSITPDKVTKIFEKREILVIPTGIQFGTVTIVMHGVPYEITTLRKDVKCFGRHAEVEFSEKFEEDSIRRDFTFNALYMDKEEKMYDYHNGMSDLEKGIVRFIGSAEDRIKEDYLRILRMFRFQAGYGKQDIIEEQLILCARNSGGLEGISGERIKSEMFKMLAYPNSADVYKKMQDNGIIEKITNLPQEKFNFDNLKNYYSAISLFNDLKEHDLNYITAIASFLEAGEENADAIAERMKFSTREKVHLIRLMESKELDLENDYEVRKSIRLDGKNEFIEYVILALSKNKINRSKALELITKAKDFDAPEFPIDAKILMEQLNLKPSKELGDILRKSEELWERSEYKLNRDEILNAVRG